MQWKAKKISRNLVVPAKLTKRENRAMIFVKKKQLVYIHAGCGIVLWPAAFVLPNALRAANDVKFTMVVGVGSMFAFRIIGPWVLCVQLGYGAKGVWAAMIVDWVCRTAFFVARMASGKWKAQYKPA